ncbi:unnamed protein product [Lactuca saligna]|uniref:histone deacetylase n=1 Tax=Lactuca saligna TaxID=75948 RepID=A0AA36A2H8_LACSI|nr:unnamed protein product [Lactuca saligna]
MKFFPYIRTVSLPKIHRGTSLILPVYVLLCPSFEPDYFDVHHGNGTQEIFEQNKTVLYISLHRHEGGKFYPGTGAAHEVGSMGGEGYCVNVPWSRGGVGDHSHRIRQSSHDPRSKRLDPKRGTIAYRSPTETPSGTSCLRSHQFFKSIPET